MAPLALIITIFVGIVMSNQWIWLVVWNIFYFSIYWEQSSQLTNSYFSEGLKLPTSGWNAVSAVSGDEVWYVRAAAASCTVGGILRHFLQYPATLPLPNRCRWWRGFRYEESECLAKKMRVQFQFPRIIIILPVKIG